MFSLETQKGKRTLKLVLGILQITLSGSKDHEKNAQDRTLLFAQSASKTWRGLWGCITQLNTLKCSIPDQISALGEYFLNVQVKVCQSKQGFRAAVTLPAQGEWSGLVGSRQEGLGCDGSWICCCQIPFPNPLWSLIQRCLRCFFLWFFFPPYHEYF